MKNRITRLVVISLAAAVAIVAVSCKKGGSSTKPADVDYYTCTMHPSVKAQDPKDKCPICHMDLVPVKKKGGNEKGPAAHAGHTHGVAMEHSGTNSMDETHEFTVPVARQQMIGVTYAGVEKRALGLTLRAVGTVAYDKQRHWDYVARV